jgi:hypothetical protein
LRISAGGEYNFEGRRDPSKWLWLVVVLPLLVAERCKQRVSFRCVSAELVLVGQQSAGGVDGVHGVAPLLVNGSVPGGVVAELGSPAVSDVRRASMTR